MKPTAKLAGKRRKKTNPLGLTKADWEHMETAAKPKPATGKYGQPLDKR